MDIEIVDSFSRIEDRTKKRYGAQWVVTAILDPLPKGAEGVIHFAEIALKTRLPECARVDSSSGWSLRAALEAHRVQVSVSLREYVAKPSRIPGDIAAWMRGKPEFAAVAATLRTVLTEACATAIENSAAEQRAEQARDLAAQMARVAVERARVAVRYEEQQKALRAALEAATEIELGNLLAEVARDGVEIHGSHEKVDVRIVQAAMRHAQICVPSRLDPSFPFATSVAPVTVEEVS